jgi:hypothetical protein
LVSGRNRTTEHPRTYQHAGGSWNSSEDIGSLERERRHDDRAATFHRTPQVRDVPLSVVRVSQEMKDRPVVPDVHGGHVPLARHVRFNPRDALLPLTQPCLRPCQRRSRHVEHEDAVHFSFNESVPGIVASAAASSCSRVEGRRRENAAPHYHEEHHHEYDADQLEQIVETFRRSLFTFVHGRFSFCCRHQRSVQLGPHHPAKFNGNAPRSISRSASQGASGALQGESASWL